MGIVVNAAKDVGQVGFGHGVKDPLHMVGRTEMKTLGGNAAGAKVNPFASEYANIDSRIALGDLDRVALNAGVLALFVAPMALSGGKLGINTTLASKVGVAQLFAMNSIR